MVDRKITIKTRGNFAAVEATNTIKSTPNMVEMMRGASIKFVNKKLAIPAIWNMLLMNKYITIITDIKSVTFFTSNPYGCVEIKLKSVYG